MGSTRPSLVHTETARLNGATEEELQESIFMAGVTRMGSTIRKNAGAAAPSR